MLIPIGTTIRHQRQPLVTQILIGANILIFALQWAIARQSGTINEVFPFFNELKLSSTHFHWYSLITYQFLHASWWHVLGNMLFLLPFGKAAEDRLGHIGFLVFFLGCGSLCGGLHALLSESPVIGASGSVCAVAASFLVLAPKTHIKVIYIFFLIGFIQIPSILFILFYVLFDTFGLISNMLGANSEPTAWMVHLGGYLSGFIICFLLLKKSYITSSEFDLPTMLSQMNRRQQYKKMIESTKKAMPSQKVNLKQADQAALERNEISKLIYDRNYEKAFEQYNEAKTTFNGFVLGKHVQLELGNWLFANNYSKNGCTMFEDYLKAYPQADDIGDVALLLLAKYTRTIRNIKKAKQILKKYKKHFSEKHLDLVESLTQEIGQ